ITTIGQAKKMTTSIQALAYHHPSEPPQWHTLPMPAIAPHDLFIEIEALGVNPIDYKLRHNLKTPKPRPKILGWDAAGTVVAKGNAVSRFQCGERVFYAGHLHRDGCYASHQLVDERLVAHAPKQLSAEHCAVIPLTGITAWEALFYRLGIREQEEKQQQLLIIGAGGGVGSMAIQLAKQVAGLDVTATVSHAKARQWCHQLGADICLDHEQDLVTQYHDMGLTAPDYILCCANTDTYFDTMATLVASEGAICALVDTQQAHDLQTLKAKSARFVWEFMFTHPIHSPTSWRHHDILQSLSQLLDSQSIISSWQQTVGPLSPDAITQAHAQLITTHTVGKIALTAR
ncbi:MAG TPA: zinc-binding alcohol dehydrogenase family protein, partial [Gammaproteobacteria bacterium]|nr:zinc-binding alcohol dehydrogenase family protein [Gammaproteobacteria bacterium]